MKKYFLTVALGLSMAALAQTGKSVNYVVTKNETQVKFELPEGATISNNVVNVNGNELSVVIEDKKTYFSKTDEKDFLDKTNDKEINVRTLINYQLQKTNPLGDISLYAGTTSTLELRTLDDDQTLMYWFNTNKDSKLPQTLYATKIIGDYIVSVSSDYNTTTHKEVKALLIDTVKKAVASK